VIRLCWLPNVRELIEHIAISAWRATRFCAYGLEWGMLLDCAKSLLRPVAKPISLNRQPPRNLAFLFLQIQARCQPLHSIESKVLSLSWNQENYLNSELKLGVNVVTHIEANDVSVTFGATVTYTIALRQLEGSFRIGSTMLCRTEFWRLAPTCCKPKMRTPERRSWEVHGFVTLLQFTSEDT